MSGISRRVQLHMQLCAQGQMSSRRFEASVSMQSVRDSMSGDATRDPWQPA